MRAGALAVVLALPGCVERFLRIDSTPPGAQIVVDGVPHGAAPVELPFEHYGTRRIDAWLPQRPGVTKLVELEPPWWQRFPFDLFADLLDPRTHFDRRVVLLEMPEASVVAEPASATLERADDLRAATR